MSSYAQMVVDDLYEEGERDFNFLWEFFDSIAYYDVRDFGTKFSIRSKSKEQQIIDILKLIKFFIDDGAYKGFYMPIYGEPMSTYSDSQEFINFLEPQLKDPTLFDNLIGGDGRYTIGLRKELKGATAPKVSSEIEKIFTISDTPP